MCFLHGKVRRLERESGSRQMGQLEAGKEEDEDEEGGTGIDMRRIWPVSMCPCRKKQGTREMCDGRMKMEWRRFWARKKLMTLTCTQ